MSEASKRVLGSAPPTEVRTEVIPDYFGYYNCEIADLLSEGENFKPLTIQTFELNDGSETELTDFRAERLKLALRQGVFDLTAEVDEMVEPVFATCQLRTKLRNKKSLSGNAKTNAFEVEAIAAAPLKKSRTASSSRKKRKTSSISTINDDTDAGSLKNGTCKEDLVFNHVDSKPVDVNVIEKEVSNGKNHCVQCWNKGNSQGKVGSEGLEYVCDACRSNNRREADLNSGSNVNVDQGNGEVDEDLQFLLENDSSLVEEAMKKYSDKLSSRLGHMEQQLESLLDSLVSKCRPMTCDEKQELHRLIKNLPQYNLDRVADIVLHKKPERIQSSNEILVELDREDHVTLWRLYYYAKAVEKAKEL